MPQPVFGNVPVNERISSDAGEAKYEEQPQSGGDQRDNQKESEMLAHKLAHAKEYTPAAERLRAPCGWTCPDCNSAAAASTLGLTALSAQLRMNEQRFS
jgi:hypothetical protein